MLKQLNRADIDQLLATIAAEYQLQAPRRLNDGTRQLGAYKAAEVSLCGAPLQRKPTAAFFPQTGLLLTLNTDGSAKQPEAPQKPFALFGLDRFDLTAISFLDRFFSDPPADDIYLRRRQGALLVGLTGFVGIDRAFQPLSSGGCDIELIATGTGWLAAGNSETGKTLLQDFPDGDPKLLCDLQKKSLHCLPNLSKLEHAAELLRQDLVPDRFWQEIADRCILCTGCNFVCPTCSCFCVQDRQTSRGTERSRVWDSCQLDAFMREASGHNPLGTEALRTRRRIHHKLVADVVRWGELGCVGCGRCDRTCPTGIGIFAVVEELVKQFGDS